MIKVAIADDHRLFRQGIQFLVDQMADIEMTLEVADGRQLIESLRQTEVDVVLLDLEMPVLDGVETIKEIRPLYPDLGIIILTTYSESKMMAYLMELGANAYLLKDSEPDILEKAIRSVRTEGFYFTSDVSQAMLKGIQHKTRKKPELRNNVKLTEREIQVLELICQEYTAKEIADKLFISPRTAEGHRRHLIEKLGVKNTAGLIVRAIKEGLVEV